MHELTCWIKELNIENSFFGRCQPNLVTYNILLRASAQACDVAGVERFFKEMETARIYPDLVSYNGVIGAYGKAGDYVQMEKTLFVMRMQKHIKPDNVTSNALIESYGRGKDFVKMEQVSLDFRVDHFDTFGSWNTLYLL